MYLKDIKFNSFDCELHIEEYQKGGAKALLLLDKEDGDYVAVATINIPELNLPKNEVVIKDYSENEGMYDLLHKEGIISEPINYIETGFVTCPVCTLLV